MTSDTPAEAVRPDRSLAATPVIPRPSTRLFARFVAEIFGTFLLVFVGIGAALFASAFPDAANAVGIGYVGVALAFGLAVVAGAYAVGGVSGGHFNPAVTLGLAVAGRTEWRAVPAYVVGQTVGGLVATTLLAAIAADRPDGYLGHLQAAGFASNGFADHSPGHFGLVAVMLIELILTAVFVYVILGVTDESAPSGFGPLVIGLTLVALHLISIPVSNTSLNPARSIATAVWAGGPALAQLWVFIIVPLVGAAIAGLTYRPLFARVRPE